MSAAQTGQGGDAGQQAQQGDAGGGPDLAGLAAQMQSLQGVPEGFQEIRDQFGQLQQLVQERLPAGEQEQQQEQDPALDLSFLDAGEPDAVAQQLQGLIDQRAQAQAEKLLSQQVSPLAEQMKEMRVEREAERLVSEFPELGDPEVAQKIAGKGGLAETLAQSLGQPELAAEPQFWRLVYMAGRAADSANQEGSQESNAATLEGGGGAVPGGGTQVDLGDLIVNGGPRGRSVLPF